MHISTYTCICETALISDDIRPTGLGGYQPDAARCCAGWRFPARPACDHYSAAFAGQPSILLFLRRILRRRVLKLNDSVAVLRADVLEMIERDALARSGEPLWNQATVIAAAGKSRLNAPTCSLPRWAPT